MGERKVLNKYYPPDFDPAKIPRLKQPKNQQMKVRMMLPMSIRCNTCGNYIYRGTKFNSRIEDAVGEEYVGIKISRLYFKCTRCSAELAIKTDPQKNDYTVESGATRNFEHWRSEDEQVAKEQRKREAEEMGDAMKSLENRTLDSKREMDILAALDEVKSMKSRQTTVSMDAMLAALQQTADEKEKQLEEEDEPLIKSLFGKPRVIIRRIDDDDLEDDDDDNLYTGEASSCKFKKRKVSEESPSSATDYLTKASETSKDEEKKPTNLEKHGKGKFILKSPMVKISVAKKPQPEEEKKQEEEATSGLQSLVQSYDSDKDE